MQNNINKRDENIVEYRIFPMLESQDEGSLVDELSNILNDIFVELGNRIIDFIWQKDQFGLQAVATTSKINDTIYPPHLHGVTRFGDNIEDEWFIVYLLSLITKKFPGCVASIQDDDGELLLIEVANYLPKWLDPDTSTNRVFIAGGELHIVPYPRTPGELPILPIGVPMVQQSVTAIQQYPQLTKTSEKIREAINSRIARFSRNLDDIFHYAICSLPVRLAAILQEDPQLVAPAVEAFYERDPIDLKACRVMKNFPPDNLVATKVKLSRIMYAQLMQQRFQPDRRSRWKIPSTSNPKFKAADLGMKMAHGFEILTSRVSEGMAEENGYHGDEKASGVRWERFLSALTKKGYFQDELEGSKRYKELYRSAERYYIESCQNYASGNNVPGLKVLKLLKNLTFDLEAFKAVEKQLPDSTDDSWLTITPEELNTILEKASGKRSMKNKANTSESDENGGRTHDNGDPNFDAELITKSFESFVDKISSYQGVKFPKGNKLDPVDFHPNKFSQAMEAILSYQSDKEEDEEEEDEEEEDEEEDSSGSLSDHFFEEDLEDAPDNEEDEKIKDLMDEMDRQLYRTEVGKSFERRSESTCEQPSEDAAVGDDTGVQEDEECYEPVEIDVNLLKNILESYSSQQGLAGPASNILHSMGVRLPPNAD